MPVTILSIVAGTPCSRRQSCQSYPDTRHYRWPFTSFNKLSLRSISLIFSLWLCYNHRSCWFIVCKLNHKTNIHLNSRKIILNECCCTDNSLDNGHFCHWLFTTLLPPSAALQWHVWWHTVCGHNSHPPLSQSSLLTSAPSLLFSFHLHHFGILHKGFLFKHSSLLHIIALYKHKTAKRNFSIKSLLVTCKVTDLHCFIEMFVMCRS